jgi:transcription termination/antitermination protein NusG
VTQNSGAMLNLDSQVRHDVIPALSPVEQAGTSWFAVQTRPRHEKKVARSLQEKEIKAFLPLFSSTHCWSDRRRVIHAPLFPSYLFVQISESLDVRVPILRTTGVVGIVGNRGVGATIPEEQIQAVQAILEQGIPFTSFPFLNAGQRVRIRGGSLDGLQGILLAKNGDQSLVVSVETIQKSLAIRVAGYHVEPI